MPYLEALLAEKEKDLQEALVDQAAVDRLLGLVIDDSGRLNPILIRGICEKFVESTHALLFLQLDDFCHAGGYSESGVQLWKLASGYELDV